MVNDRVNDMVNVIVNHTTQSDVLFSVPVLLEYKANPLLACHALL